MPKILEEFKINPIGQLQTIISFTNGYGASILLEDKGEELLFELAVLKDNELCYTTPITSDVLRYQTIEETNKVLEQIEQL